MWLCSSSTSIIEERDSSTHLDILTMRGAAKGYNSATTQLMTCINKLRSSSGIVLIAATDFYDGLDRALIREGRFDLHIQRGRPRSHSAESRYQIRRPRLQHIPWPSKHHPTGAFLSE
jgi:ATP-dependent Zn protease